MLVTLVVYEFLSRCSARRNYSYRRAIFGFFEGVYYDERFSIWYLSNRNPPIFVLIAVILIKNADCQRICKNQSRLFEADAMFL